MGRYVCFVCFVDWPARFIMENEWKRFTDDAQIDMSLPREWAAETLPNCTK